MSNIIRVRKTNQAWHETNCYLDKYMITNLDKYFRSLPPKQYAIANYIFNKNHIFGGVMYFCQDAIGEAVGCSTRWVVETLKKFREDNILISNYRHETSCQYKISRTFDYAPVISKMAHIFPVFQNVVSRFSVDATLLEFRRLNIKNNNDIYITEKSKNDPLKMWGMNEHGTSFVLNTKNYSLEQKISLSAFPDCALEHAIFCSQFVINMRNECAYVFKVAWDYCKRFEIKPDWGWVNKLRDMYAMNPVITEEKERFEVDKSKGIAVMIAQSLKVTDPVKRPYSFQELMELCEPLISGTIEERQAADNLVQRTFKTVSTLPKKDQEMWRLEARLYKQNKER